MAAKLRLSPSKPAGRQVLDGGAQGEVEQPVGMVARVAAHEVEGEAVDAGGRDELAHGRGRAVGGADHGEQQTGVAGVEDPAQHHGEAPLVLALAGQAHQVGQLARSVPGSMRDGSWKVAV